MRSEIRRHDRLYYVDASPEITDLEYDRLMRRLVALESAHPELFDLQSPTRRIGDAPVDHLQQAPHRLPMLSIENAYDEQELAQEFEGGRRGRNFRTGPQVLGGINWRY